MRYCFLLLLILFFKSLFSMDSNSLFFSDDFNNLDTGIVNSENWVLDSTDGVWSIIEEEKNKFLHYEANSKNKSPIALLKNNKWENREDYYFEAKIRVLDNKTTANKYLVLITKYKDVKNWIGAGLTMKETNTATRVITGKSVNGKFKVENQVLYPLDLGQWYTLRVEIKGGTVTSYLNGDKCDEIPLDKLEATTWESGIVGLWTYNKSFDIDDIVIGNPINKPASLTITPEVSTFETRALENSMNINIFANKDDGTKDSFIIKSLNPEIVKVNRLQNSITLNAISEGETTIEIISGYGRKKTINAKISPAYVTGDSMYKNLKKSTIPAAESLNAFYDGELKLSFDNSDITLQPGHSVRIVNKETNVIIDEINIGEEIDRLGFNYNPIFRSIKREMVYLEGNTLIIKPHDGTLEPNRSYYILIERGSVKNAYLSGVPFDGLSEKNKWTFTTKDLVHSNKLIVGSGINDDFITIQGAINHLMKFSNNSGTIFVKNGEYHEALYANQLSNITISGESREGVKIHFLNAEKFNGGTGKGDSTLIGTPQGGRALFLIENCDLLTIENLTMVNTHIRTGDSDQAEVIYFKANPSDRLIVKSANIISEQDTIQVRGNSWFYNCLISGNVDFIWGNNIITLFENCEIRTVGDSKAKTGSSTGGYILQARTEGEDSLGFVFLNCSLTFSKGPIGVDVLPNSTFLARSGGSRSYLDYITFVNTKMDKHIISSGWADKDAGHPTPTGDRWQEFGSVDMNGNPLDINSRSKSGKVLTELEIKGIYDSRESVFKNYNNGEGWSPQL